MHAHLYDWSWLLWKDQRYPVGASASDHLDLYWLHVVQTAHGMSPFLRRLV